MNIPSWLNDAKNLARSECSICVVGNKSDLTSNREVSFIEGSRFCQENNILHFECSAYTGDNVDDIFILISKHLINKIENGLIDQSSVISEGLKKIKKDTLKNGSILFEHSNSGTCTELC